MPASQTVSIKPCGGCRKSLHGFGQALAIAIAVHGVASTAQAELITFLADSELSKLTITQKIVGPAVGGSKTSVPQFAGSNTTSFYGTLLVERLFSFPQDTIRLLPDFNLWALPGAPGQGGTPGLFAPFDPVTHPPSSGNPGFNPGSNYGLSLPFLGSSTVWHDVGIHIGYTPSSGPQYPSAAIPMTADGRFSLAGQAMSFTVGHRATVSALGNSTTALNGNEFIFFHTSAIDTGALLFNWEQDFGNYPIETLYVLVLPVHSSFSRVLTTEFGGISEFLDVTGQLVFYSVPIPEPGTFTLLGIAGLALLCCGYRFSRPSADQLRA